MKSCITYKDSFGIDREMPKHWLYRVDCNYNGSVKWCHNCEKEIDIYKNIIGFFHCSDLKFHPMTNTGVIVECPTCFDRWWFHATDDFKETCYDLFSEIIDNNIYNRR